jgi:hypothetical protein
MMKIIGSIVVIMVHAGSRRLQRHPRPLPRTSRTGHLRKRIWKGPLPTSGEQVDDNLAFRQCR